MNTTPPAINFVPPNGLEIQYWNGNKSLTLFVGGSDVITFLLAEADENDPYDRSHNSFKEGVVTDQNKLNEIMGWLNT